MGIFGDKIVRGRGRDGELEDGYYVEGTRLESSVRPAGAHLAYDPMSSDLVTQQDGRYDIVDSDGDSVLGISSDTRRDRPLTAPEADRMMAELAEASNENEPAKIAKEKNTGAHFIDMFVQGDGGGHKLTTGDEAFFGDADVITVLLGWATDQTASSHFFNAVSLEDESKNILHAKLDDGDLVVGARAQPGDSSDNLTVSNFGKTDKVDGCVIEFNASSGTIQVWDKDNLNTPLSTHDNWSVSSSFSDIRFTYGSYLFTSSTQDGDCWMGPLLVFAGELESHDRGEFFDYMRNVYGLGDSFDFS